MPGDSHTQFCPTCQRNTEHIGEASHAAGTVVFIVSILSCGMLFPITLPLTFYFLLTKKPKLYCRECRSSNG